MTLAELDDAIGNRKVIRHQGQCFVNVYSETEAVKFTKLGAHVRPAGGQEKPTPHWGTPCWEVHLAGMVDPVVVTERGEEKDITAQVVLDHFRARDGFSGYGRYATLFK